MVIVGTPIEIAHIVQSDPVALDRAARDSRDVICPHAVIGWRDVLPPNKQGAERRREGQHSQAGTACQSAISVARQNAIHSATMPALSGCSPAWYQIASDAQIRQEAKLPAG